MLLDKVVCEVDGRAEVEAIFLNGEFGASGKDSCGLR